MLELLAFCVLGLGGNGGLVFGKLFEDESTHGKEINCTKDGVQKVDWWEVSPVS